MSLTFEPDSFSIKINFASHSTSTKVSFDKDQ